MRYESQRRAPGFTLVELLVVTAIIGLALAIILPGLAAATEASRRTVCAAHLHGVVNGWEAYAADWGSLPVIARRGEDINFDINARRSSYALLPVSGFEPETHQMYLDRGRWTASWLRNVIFQAATGTSDPEYPGRWRNFGILYRDGVVRNPRAFFCPSQADEDFAWDTPLNPWPPSAATIWRPDQPGTANHTQASFERHLGLSHVPWERVSPRVAITTDILDPENVRETHGYGINAAYRDGHVVFLTADRVLSWYTGDESMSLVEQWERFRRDILIYYDWLDRQQ